MRTFTILPAIAALAILAGSAAIAQERTTASATLVDPITHAYVGTFVEACAQINQKNPSHPNLKTWPYVGAYLGKAFNLQGSQFLSLATGNKPAFTTSPRANGEENTVYEVGGVSQDNCIADGTVINLLFGFRGATPIVIGTGTVHSL